MILCRPALRSICSAGVLLISGCRNPAADAAMAEQMRQVADELNGVRQDAAATREQIDSLRTALARQDTLVRQLANAAGVPVPQR